MSWNLNKHWWCPVPGLRIDEQGYGTSVNLNFPVGFWQLHISCEVSLLSHKVEISCVAMTTDDLQTQKCNESVSKCGNKNPFPDDLMVLDRLDYHCWKSVERVFIQCEVLCTLPRTAARCWVCSHHSCGRGFYRKLTSSWGGKLQEESDTENRLRPRFPHDAHRGKLSEDLRS